MRFSEEILLIGVRARKVCSLASGRQIAALGTATCIMAITGASTTGVALLLGSLVDRVKLGLSDQWSRNQILSAAGWVLGAIALLYLVREFLNVLRRNLVDRVLAGLSRDLLCKIVDHVLHLDLQILSQEKVGSLHGKVMRSVDGVIRFVRILFLDCLPAAFTGAFALAAAVTKSPLLGLTMIGVVPISLWLTLRQLNSQREVRLKLMRDCEEIDGAIVEQLNGAEYVRVANTYTLESERLAKVTARKRARETHHHFVMSWYGCGKALNEGAFHIFVLSLATWFAVNGQISFGDILVFSVLFLNVMTPLNEIHRILDEGHESSLCVADYLEMMSKPKDRSFETKSNSLTMSRVKLIPRAPAIEVHDLIMEYQASDGSRSRALNGVSFSIAHGETVGISGRSGCGKSTLIKSLLRLYHPTSGEVRVGGIPLHHISREEIARLIGYVGQMPFAISGSLHENIAYGASEFTPNDVIRAAQLAQLHEDVLLLPQKYQTEVGERGQNLSGGQRQRMAIARLLLHNSPIVILDEATSALDNISERYIQQALSTKSADRTTILIAHRLSTLRDCDQILVFDAGRIVEVGDYDTLVNAGGLFTRLVLSAEQRSPEMAGV